MADDLTQQVLRAILNYDPDTGSWTWRISRANSVKVGTKHVKQCALLRESSTVLSLA